jgi:hypothetical protein
MLSNTTAIAEAWARLDHKFDLVIRFIILWHKLKVGLERILCRQRSEVILILRIGSPYFYHKNVKYFETLDFFSIVCTFLFSRRE